MDTISIRRARLAAATVLWALTLGLQAITLQGGLEASLSSESPNPSPVAIEAGLLHRSESFDAFWSLIFLNGREWKAPFQSYYFGSYSVAFGDAGLRWRLGGAELSVGVLPATDSVESPYSLFASGQRIFQTEISYRDERFFYTARWMGLNHDIDAGLFSSPNPLAYADRGAVLKYYGFTFGGLRFGFEDALVFAGSYFDPEAFLIPAPGYFVQYIPLAPGRPTTRSSAQNMNSLMGFFADWRGEGSYAYAQVLIDDLDMNRFLDPDNYHNPDKVAWSLGGALDSEWGDFGLFTAGATKYTFESITGRFYSYTRYPGSAVLYEGSLTGIPVGEEMLGYLHGENNLALMGTWSGSFGRLALSARAEFSVSGSKSPANPWHEYANYGEGGEGTRFLDEARLEYRLEARLGGEYALGPLRLRAGVGGGYVWNELALVEVLPSADGNAEPLWKPSAASRFFGSLFLGGRLGVEVK